MQYVFHAPCVVCAQRGVQSSVVALVTSCSYLGAALASALSPPLIAAFGWPSVFYAFGLLGFLWLPPWMMFAPAGSHGRRDSGDGGAGPGSGGGGEGADDGRRGRLPWHLLRRREVWAICAAQFGTNWGFFCLLNWLPTYFRCTCELMRSEHSPDCRRLIEQSLAINRARICD